MSNRTVQAREKRARTQARLLGARPAPIRSSYFLPLLLSALLWVAVVALLDLGEGLVHAPLSEGQRAPATVLAQVDFETHDIAGTELARRQKAETVLPVFAIHRAPLQSALRELDRLFDELEDLRTADKPDERPATIQYADLTLRTDEALAMAPPAEEDELRDAIRQALQRVWTQGIVSVSERESRFHGVAAKGEVSVRINDDTVRSPVDIHDLYTPEEAARAVLTRVQNRMTLRTAAEHTLYPLVRAWIQPNLIYDSGATERARQSARRTIEPVTKQVRAGATLINQGDRVTPQELENWRAHQRRVNELQSPQDRFLQWAGRSFLLLFALIICSGLLQIVRPDIVQSPSRITLLVILALLTLVSVKGLLYLANTTQFLPSSLVEFMLPLAFAPILTTLLVGPATAVVIGVWTSFAAAVMFDNSFSIFAMGLLVTIIVAHTARQIRRRSRMVRIGLWVGLAQMVYSLSLAVLNQLPPNLVFLQAGVALLMGVLTALLALLFLPLLETLFDSTTDITLLELSDMGHPLLQRLAIEAPGTYHHSLMVASLAQAAAANIGANALLVRVCAYFHDIGKLTKPEFFVENTQFRENPHDDLTPSMSALVIISHVKEGVGMARRAKLPSIIIDAIQQHHGTGLVAFFYHRARLQDAEQTATAGNGRGVSEGNYRYSGPKPRTPEMGILLLADSVEAASRSMDKPTPSRIKHLVNDIVDARLQDEQLDNCDLTFAELKAIKESFIFTLTNMLHGRVPYPKDENRNQQPAEEVPDTAPPTEGVRPMDHATSASP